MKKTAFLFLFSSFLVSAFAATLTHNYQLTSSLSDTLGGPALVSDGGTQSGTGYAFGVSQGLNLSSALANSGDYSILMDFSYANLPGYRKILDFQDRASDTGFYNLNSDLNFYPVVTGGVAFTADVLARVVLTRDAGTNSVTGYVNGAQQWTFTDSSSLAVFSGANNIIRFFEDDFATGQGEASGGVATKIQIYDGALSADAVEILGGPSGIPAATEAPEPAALTLAGIGLLGLGIVRRNKA